MRWIPLSVMTALDFSAVGNNNSEMTEYLIKHGAERGSEGRLMNVSGTEPHMFSSASAELVSAIGVADKGVVDKLMETEILVSSVTGVLLRWQGEATGHIVRVRVSKFSDQIVHLHQPVQCTMSMDELLLEAAADGDATRVLGLLEDGADARGLMGLWTTPLALAAHFGRLEVARLLVENGADANLSGKSGDLPLVMAVEGCEHWGGLSSSDTRLDLVRLLVEAGADVNGISGEEGVTAIVAAAARGDADVVQFLIGKGADVNAANDLARTQLLIAAESGHLEVVQALVDQGADVNYSSKSCGETALWNAVNQGDLEAAEYLIEHGANVNVENQFKQTPLIEAVRNGDLEIVQCLLENEANANSADYEDKTPLMSAASDGRVDIMMLLIDHGADVAKADRFGRTSLYRAAEDGCVDAVGYLLDHGADPNATAQQNRAPLMHAAANGCTDVVKLLVDRGANTSLKDDFGRTALSFAEQYEHHEIEQFLSSFLPDKTC